MEIMRIEKWEKKMFNYSKSRTIQTFQYGETTPWVPRKQKQKLMLEECN